MPTQNFGHITDYGSGAVKTTYSVARRTITHPVTCRRISGWFVLEDGKVYQTICYETREKAETEARATAKIRTGRYADCGAHGWPLVAGGPNDAFPNEKKLVCPSCGKADWTMFSVPDGAGSGPGGRFRFGDNSRGAIRCNACGRTDTDREVTVMR